MSGWLRSRWAVGAAAWAAFATAIGFAGDVLGGPLEHAVARVGLIASTGIAWLAWELWRARRTLLENERLLEGLVGGIAAQDSAERAAHELSVLRKRFEDALETLRKARFRGTDGERRTVRELPWYMFIGAPGSGKTTALLNAGLRFPLGDPRAGNTIQGVGGTRNCDWWFTDEAVLLDTAGRYTTQESDKEADAAAWLGFLDLLKRFRARQPLNGAIVTLSVADLVHWNSEELGRYAGHVRERLRELYGRLGTRLPIYVLVTKCDLLAGFNEFFAELDSEGRAQVWGATFELADAVQPARPAADRFDAEFAALERRLYAVLPGRLQEERDLQRRAAIYRFPQQFRVAGPLIGAFLEGVFGPGWTGETPLLRGVYFASGTQEGSPIDRVLGTLARSFNLERKVQPPSLGMGKSFFLKRLMREVIFGESGLAGMDLRQERARRLSRLAACATLVAATLGLGAAWTASYFASRQAIAAVEEAVNAAGREMAAAAPLKPGDEARLAALLDRLDDLTTMVGAPSWGAGFGLDQSSKLRMQAERAYRNALRETLLAHLDASLRHALRARPSPDALAAYVALHETAPLDAEGIERAALDLWRPPASSQPALAGHLRAALAQRPFAMPAARDEALIEQARRKLAGRGST
jgi:type VI secretion system protein ImpL